MDSGPFVGNTTSTLFGATYNYNLPQARQSPWQRGRRYKRKPTKGAFGANRGYGQTAIYPAGRWASF